MFAAYSGTWSSRILTDQMHESWLNLNGFKPRISVIMKRFISKLIDQASDLAQREPVISLFIGAAMVALLVAAYRQCNARASDKEDPFLRWLYLKFESLLWASLLVA